MKVLVYGASTNPERYAFIATHLLMEKGHEVVLIGHKKGQIKDLEILTENVHVADVDTVTLYVGPRNQEGLLEYLSFLQVKRVIFNPGTENPELEIALRTKGIQVEVACTLVLLHTGQF
ncbi:CoA-binding protein [Aquirufa sp. ROCK2-A2]